MGVNLADSATRGGGGEPAKIRVFLLITNRLMRDTLVHVLQRREDLELAGRASPTETKPEEVVKCGCDVVLVDFVEAEWFVPLRSQCPTGKPMSVVAIGMNPERAEFLEAVRCGVSGYLLKDASASEVITAVRAAFRGEATCPPQLCVFLFQAMAQERRRVKTERPEARRVGLTLRQHMLIRQVAQGLTNKEIAARLNLSEFTVRNHISRILKQLQAESRREAVDAVLGFESRSVREPFPTAT
jgi:two-component system nitrate/nitrite response regulator NarL